MSNQTVPQFQDPSLSRRRMVQSLSATGTAFLTPSAIRAAETLRVARKDVEIQITPVSPHTFRLTVQPIEDGKLTEIADDGTLVQTAFGPPAAKLRGTAKAL